MNFGHENPPQRNNFGSVVYFLKNKKKNHSFAVPIFAIRPALSGGKINHLTVFSKAKH